MQLPTLQSELQKKVKPIAFDPYRPFFILGWVLGMVGVIPWLLLLYGWMDTYPREIHADVMVGGFLLAFTIGFLGTALPRFTGSFGMERWEYLPLLLSILATVSAFYSRTYFYGVALCGVMVLFSFCVRRVKLRSTLPPAPFVFVLVGLGASALSLLCLLMPANPFENIASLYFYQGQQLLFVLGVGAFLIPNLLGHPGCMPPIAHAVGGGVKSSYMASIPKPLWMLSGLFLISFIFQGVGIVWLGLLMRALLISLIAIRQWKIYKMPRVRSTVSYGLWFSCWFLVLGLWAQLLFPHLDIHNRHLLYLGGFGLMIFMIASRVTLAHGGHDMSLEKSSRMLKSVLFFLVLATMTRSIARLLPEAAYLDHLKYAAFSWLTASVIWGVVMVPKCLKNKIK